MDVLLVLVRPPDLQPWRASHSMPQRLHALRTDIDPVYMEELDFRDWSAVHLFKDFRRIRSLDLIAVVFSHDTLAIWAAW